MQKLTQPYLLELPPEIFREIIKELDTPLDVNGSSFSRKFEPEGIQALQSLLLVHPQLTYSVKLTLWRTLSLNVKSIERLHALVMKFDKNPEFASFVRELSVNTKHDKTRAFDSPPSLGFWAEFIEIANKLNVLQSGEYCIQSLERNLWNLYLVGLYLLICMCTKLHILHISRPLALQPNWIVAELLREGRPTGRAADVQRLQNLRTLNLDSNSISAREAYTMLQLPRLTGLRVLGLCFDSQEDYPLIKTKVQSLRIGWLKSYPIGLDWLLGCCPKLLLFSIRYSSATPFGWFPEPEQPKKLATLSDLRYLVLSPKSGSPGTTELANLGRENSVNLPPSLRGLVIWFNTNLNQQLSEHSEALRAIESQVYALLASHKFNLLKKVVFRDLPGGVCFSTSMLEGWHMEKWPSRFIFYRI